jgi:hypothetical protein
MDNSSLGERSIVVDAVVRKLAVAEHYIGASLVYMPIFYPSGSSVVLQISGGGRGYVVTDRGGAYFEAESMGAIRSFRQEATKIVTEAAVSFDGREFSVEGVTNETLPAVIQAVTHYSQLAANITSMRVADKAREAAGTALYERLAGIFTPQRVSKDVEIVCASQHPWSFDAMVSNGEKRVVFDAVGSSQQSVVWAVTKFGDLSRLERSYGRIAVVESNKAMGDMMGVISPNVSAIVEMRAPDQTFKTLELQTAA